VTWERIRPWLPWIWIGVVALGFTAFGLYSLGHDHPTRLPDAPSWTDQTTAVATAATALILLVTAIVAIRGIQDGQRTRHGQLTLDIAKELADPRMTESMRLFGNHGNAGITVLVQKLYGGTGTATPEELDTFWKLVAVPTLMEGIAVLESEGVLSARVIHKMWGPLIVGFWAGWEQAITEIRTHDEQDAQASFTYFERLAERMRELDQQRAGH